MWTSNQKTKADTIVIFNQKNFLSNFFNDILLYLRIGHTYAFGIYFDTRMMDVAQYVWKKMKMVVHH